jgi:hypothetical protein
MIVGRIRGNKKFLNQLIKSKEDYFTSKINDLYYLIKLKE